MVADPTAQRENNEDAGQEEAPSEPDLARVQEELHAAIETVGILTENLRTYLLTRK
jgi:hypothetical protein